MKLLPSTIIVNRLDPEPISGIIYTELHTHQRRGLLVSHGEDSGIKAEPGDIIHYHDSSAPYLEDGNVQFLHQNDILAVEHRDGSLSATSGMILVTTEGSRFNDTIKHGSLDLIVPTNEPNWTHASKTKLTVSGVSEGTSKELSVGDAVFVNYGVVLNDRNRVVVGGADHWKAYCLGPGADVYAVERSGNIEAVFGWCLVKPAITTIAKSDILEIPDITEMSETFGTIRYVGENETNPKLEVGMDVVFHEHDAFLNDFNGEKLYTMKVERINMVICQE
jgi:hypothetical protein